MVYLVMVEEKKLTEPAPRRRQTSPHKNRRRVPFLATVKTRSTYTSSQLACPMSAQEQSRGFVICFPLLESCMKQNSHLSQT
jgi:hypothetical protein